MLCGGSMCKQRGASKTGRWTQFSFSSCFGGLPGKEQCLLWGRARQGAMTASQQNLFVSPPFAGACRQAAGKDRVPAGGVRGRAWQRAKIAFKQILFVSPLFAGACRKAAGNDRVPAGGLRGRARQGAPQRQRAHPTQARHPQLSGRCAHSYMRVCSFSFIHVCAWQGALLWQRAHPAQAGHPQLPASSSFWKVRSSMCACACVHRCVPGKELPSSSALIQCKLGILNPLEGVCMCMHTYMFVCLHMHL